MRGKWPSELTGHRQQMRRSCSARDDLQSFAELDLGKNICAREHALQKAPFEPTSMPVSCACTQRTSNQSVFVSNFLARGELTRHDSSVAQVCQMTFSRLNADIHPPIDVSRFPLGDQKCGVALGAMGIDLASL